MKRSFLYARHERGPVVNGVPQARAAPAVLVAGFGRAVCRAGQGRRLRRGQVVWLTGDTLDSMAAAARRVGIPLVGHPPKQNDFERAIRVGYRSIEHGIIIASDSSDSMPGLRRLAEMMQRAGVWSCPTEFHYEDDNPLIADWSTLRYLKEEPQKLAREWFKERLKVDSSTEVATEFARKRKVVKGPP
jgi:hypothetical protein